MRNRTASAFPAGVLAAARVVFLVVPAAAALMGNHYAMAEVEIS